MSDSRGSVCYAVVSGDYSDYTVHRVFSTRRMAEEWIGLLGESYEIEEFAFDDMSDQPVAGLFGMIRMDGAPDVDIYGPREVGENGDIVISYGSPYNLQRGYYLRMYFVGTDREGAAKVLNEKRAQLFALGWTSYAVDYSKAEFYERNTLLPKNDAARAALGIVNETK